MAKTKYYLIGVTTLIVLIIGYHFIAASQAEDQIDEAIQEQATKSEAMSVQYSSIDVAPFSGNVSMSDLTFIFGNYIERAQHIELDLGYLDFLKIYLGGTEYGLKNINRMNAIITRPAVVFQESARELKGDILDLNYEGNMYDMLRHSVTGVPMEHAHHLEAVITHFRLTQPGAKWGSFRADSLYFQADVPTSALSLVNAKHLRSKADGIIWNPPKEIQEKYGFFMRGFGYDTGSVPVDSLLLRLNASDENNRKQMNLDLHTELFHARAVAGIRLNSQTYSKSIFEGGTVSLIETSKEFDNFLRNAEKLFGTSLPHQSEQLLEFSGPLTAPDISANR